MAKRRREPNVFFPWERRPGVFGALGRTRARLFLAAAAALSFVLFVHGREEYAAEVRATRATITTAREAVFDFRADHGGKCPGSLADLVPAHYARSPLVDAWGRPLRLSCRASGAPREDLVDFDVSSDGPDGVAGGLDRIE